MTGAAAYHQLFLSLKGDAAYSVERRWAVNQKGRTTYKPLEAYIISNYFKKWL